MDSPIQRPRGSRCHDFIYIRRRCRVRIEDSANASFVQVLVPFKFFPFQVVMDDRNHYDHLFKVIIRLVFTIAQSPLPFACLRMPLLNLKRVVLPF